MKEYSKADLELFLPETKDVILTSGSPFGDIDPKDGSSGARNYSFNDPDYLG